MIERRGAYVSFDGGEGVGKSTQINLFKQNYDIRTVREPGETAAGQQLRSLILCSETDSLTPEAEVLLFSADRNLTYYTVIEPTLALGKSVISDRSYLGTIAYQEAGRGVPSEYIRAATQLAIGNARPDKFVIFDMAYELAQERLLGTGKIPADDRFEREAKAFHIRVRNKFLELSRELGTKALLLDASGTVDETYEQIDEAIGELLVEGVAV